MDPKQDDGRCERCRRKMKKNEYRMGCAACGRLICSRCSCVPADDDPEDPADEVVCLQCF